MSAATTPVRSGFREFLGSNRVREAIEAYILILPTILGLVIFTAGPVLASLYFSFTRWNLLSSPKWQGLDNYIELFTNDPIFWVTIRNTALYVLGTVPTGTVLALLLAIALNQKIRMLAVFRTIYFLPVVSSVVAISVLWLWLYQADFGLINQFLRFLGFRGVRWLSSTTWAMPAIIIMSIWHGLGYNIVIFIAGLQSIPQDYYEAATVDGATAWYKFRKITIPLISPVTFFVITLSIINSFQVFAQAYVMTQGGPVNATKTIVYYLYQQGFMHFHMGYASALAYVLFVIIVMLTLFQFWFQRRWVHYEI
ncbi:sugar ABC transporter permease [Chloroflexi bacterium TSY]|nr:sugar ABC transporter permease [Chloroflexi bacterium TSY]